MMAIYQSVTLFPKIHHYEGVPNLVSKIIRDFNEYPGLTFKVWLLFSFTSIFVAIRY